MIMKLKVKLTFSKNDYCIRFQIKLNPLHIWQNKISKSTTYLYCIALLNILFLKIYGARKLQECRILQSKNNYQGRSYPKMKCTQICLKVWWRVTKPSPPRPRCPYGRGSGVNVAKSCILFIHYHTIDREYKLFLFEKCSFEIKFA
jgi:hypothetical protein